MVCVIFLQCKWQLMLPEVILGGLKSVLYNMIFLPFKTYLLLNSFARQLYCLYASISIMHKRYFLKIFTTLNQEKAPLRVNGSFGYLWLAGSSSLVRSKVCFLFGYIFYCNNCTVVRDIRQAFRHKLPFFKSGLQDRSPNKPGSVFHHCQQQCSFTSDTLDQSLLCLLYF